MARAPTYLKKRRLCWYVQYPVPKPLWAALGRRTVERTLQTRDETEAMRKRHAVIADILVEFDRAAGRPPKVSSGALLERAKEDRALVESGALSELDAEAAFDHAADKFLERQARSLGRGADGHPLMPEAEVRTLRRARKALDGTLEHTIRVQLDAYLREQAGHLTAAFVQEKTQWIESFAQWYGDDRECSEVTRAELGRYVAEVIQKRTRKVGASATAEPRQLSVSSRQKEAGAIRGFFDWLSARGVIADDPSVGMSRTIRASRRGVASGVRPWTAAELETVLRGVPTVDPVWSLAVLAAYTGMRREEITQLRVSDVEAHMFRVSEGKTQSAVRRVPIHPDIAPLVQQLVKSSGDGYLIPGLLTTGRDKKRGTLIGKRFLSAIRGLGISDPELDLHAFRATVVTQLRPHVELSIIQRIVGHKSQGVTLTHYAGDLPDETLQGALGRVSYGEGVAALIAEAAPGVVIARKSRARKAAKVA